MKMNLPCPRCGERHVAVFTPLRRPSPSYNCWAVCPYTREPIVGQMFITNASPDGRPPMTDATGAGGVPESSSDAVRKGAAP